MPTRTRRPVLVGAPGTSYCSYGSVWQRALRSTCKAKILAQRLRTGRGIYGEEPLTRNGLFSSTPI
jgi:hypothetical protein